MPLRPVQLVVALVVGALAVGASHASQSSAAPVCQLAGSWTHTTQDVGSATWDITAGGQAQERGLGYATGTATLSGNVLTIDWTTTNGYAGVYRWSLEATCNGTGTLTFTKMPPGDNRGNSHPSTVTGPAPAEPPGTERLQRDLRRLGLYAGPLDGKSGPQLTAAVKGFQRRVGLPADGTCDQRCRSALNRALGLDDPNRPPGATPTTSRTVKELQRDLKRLGFYSGPIDGRNDADTTAAVKRFQRDAGLHVDGRCAARCQFALVRRLTRKATGRALLPMRRPG